MKTLSICLAVCYCLCSGFAFGQDDKKKRSKRNFGTRYGLGVDLGFNNYLNNGEFPDEATAPTVRPWGSWHVALKFKNQTHATGIFYLNWGVDVSWYNFKFENRDTRIIKGPDDVQFVRDPQDLDFIKSKLTATYLNASFVPTFRLGGNRGGRGWFWGGVCERDGFSIGVGGYGGYRLDSYAKYVFKEEGDKRRDRERSDFFLNNWRYGLRLELGMDGIDLFFNYDLNELFVSGRGPELNAISFGLAF